MRGYRLAQNNQARRAPISTRPSAGISERGKCDNWLHALRHEASPINGLSIQDADALPRLVVDQLSYDLYHFVQQSSSPRDRVGDYSQGWAGSNWSWLA